MKNLAGWKHFQKKFELTTNLINPDNCEIFSSKNVSALIWKYHGTERLNMPWNRFYNSSLLTINISKLCFDMMTHANFMMQTYILSLSFS